MRERERECWPSANEESRRTTLAREREGEWGSSSGHLIIEARSRPKGAGLPYMTSKLKGRGVKNTLELACIYGHFSLDKTWTLQAGSSVPHNTPKSQQIFRMQRGEDQKNQKYGRHHIWRPQKGDNLLHYGRTAKPAFW